MHNDVVSVALWLLRKIGGRTYLMPIERDHTFKPLPLVVAPKTKLPRYRPQNTMIWGLWVSNAGLVFQCLGSTGDLVNRSVVGGFWTY